ncbi:MAG: hypothetical protein P1U87_17225 [Verrucomicrobiales bacterium]|nr:hypothetical protein [Verrucomicrobiales bacterium]
MFKAFLAAIIGAVIAFGWSSISWIALPFHEDTLNGFENESAIAEAIRKEVKEPGIYILPGDKSMEQEAKMEAMKNGPFLFASIRPGKDEDMSMGKSMVRGFTSTLVASILLAIMLGAVAPRLNYAGRVGFVVLMTLFTAIVGFYPNQIWWEFSTGFVLCNIMDAIIGWGLAALVMAGMINGK